MSQQPDLKPAHEVVMDQIKKHCGDLALMDDWIRKGGFESSGRWVSPTELQETRLQPVGGLISQLDGLEKMIVPTDKLEWVIEQLKKTGKTYRHAAIDHVAEKLAERRATAAV
jgi:hypothetical protein